jgi:uncharacterized repeat protein (TIGR01451 family)
LYCLAPVAAHAQWTAVAAPGAFLDTCVLLTDGRAMCHVYNTNQWRVLSPDINGNYATGTWANTANMPNGVDASIPACSGAGGCVYAPTYFASQVLPDGQVVVVGGEYLAVTGNNAVWTNIGFMYDPVADTWSNQLTVPFAGGCVGDASAIVLENGTMILADGTDCTTNGNLASFNPATLTFTALNPTGKADRNNEENWAILPDGRILTVDARVAAQSEIYDPVTNTWGNRANTVVNMADCCGGVGNSAEVGPVVLRPDGTGIGFSGNSLGQNAVYDIATNTWSNTAAMNFADSAPAGDGTDAVADGTASLLPNGNVLVMASPVLNTDTFNPPASFYEWDGTNLTQVSDSPNAANFNAYQGRMLLLPTGHVLLTAHDQNATQDVLLYHNGGGPQNAWRPVITSAPNTVIPGNTYPITGTLFNGFSEGAYYGDDAQSSTNYPLVRIRNIGSGHVFYARTHDHSKMGIDPVGSVETTTTSFDVPLGLESGPSELVVVTNGIPSQPIIINGPDLTITKTHAPALFTQGDVGDTFTITVRNSGPEPTTGVVTMVDTLPASLTATGLAGAGWACVLGTLTCTRNDALAANSSYPAITLTVNVANDAPILVTNHASASGGGEAANATANSSTTESVNVRQHTVTTVSPVTQHYHDIAILRATVTPAGVDGTVQFFVEGVPVGFGTYNSVTGVATLAYVIPLPSGGYDLRADFTSGEVLYLDSTHTLVDGLTVTQEENTLTYTGQTVIANGEGATLTATLFEDGPEDNDGDGGSLPIAGRTIHFTLGTGITAQTCDALTNLAGSATCVIDPVNQPLGPGTVSAAFAGDAFYQPNSDAAATIIFAFLETGSFTLGNLSDDVGATGTFWSSDWSTLNALSGGAAPTSFKGFINGLSTQPPVCGGTWTSQQGGNSVAPPAEGTLPSYMGVVVSSIVTKTGNTAAGNIVSIVVVQTNSGYSTAPGHTGTGTVVAVYCP